MNNYSESIAIAVSAVSAAICSGKTIEQIELLAVVFTQIGDTLATIALLQQNTDNTAKTTV